MAHLAPFLTSAAFRAARYAAAPAQTQYAVSQYTPGSVAVYTTNTMQSTPPYTPGPLQYTQGPPQYTQGPPQYTQGPPQYTPGVPQNTQDPPQYTSGIPQYTPGQPQYSPYPQGTPPCTQSGQQQSANVMVVNSQPTAVESTIVVHSTRDHYLTLSISMTIICLACLGCGWLPLLCTITAIIISLSARSDERSGDVIAAKRKAKVSLSLNIISGIVLVILIVVTIATFAYFRSNSLSYASDVVPATDMTTGTTFPTPNYYVCSSNSNGYTYYYYC
eukprot:Em0001g569a